MILPTLGWVDLTTAVVFISVFVFTIYGIPSYRKRIPGPFALPIVGNALTLMKMKQQSHIELLKLKEKYGDVFRLYFGPFELIFICGYKCIHEAFLEYGSIFGHRPNWLSDIRTRAEKYGYGIAWGNGEEWRRLRRFAIQTMKDFGVGKTSLEEVILEETRLLCKDFASREGQPIHDVKGMMTLPISNVVHHITFGFRYPHNDESFLRIIHLYDEVFKGPSAILASLPEWSQPRQLKADIKSSRGALSKILDYIADQIADHENTYDENNIRDFVDLYIQAQRADKQTKGQKPTHHMFQVIVDLFSAATETTGTTMDWALLYMIAYPDIQQKCFEDIKKAVGLGREVRLSDKKALVYIEATILEIQRLSNVASMSLPHTNTEEVEIAGYVIPKNSIIVGFLATAHLDPKLFPEPFHFRPERFINKDTGAIAQPKEFIPFSMGPRACPGDSFAKNQMFLFFGNLIQRFRFSKVSEDDILDLTGITGITTSACPYRLKVESRHHGQITQGIFL